MAHTLVLDFHVVIAYVVAMQSTRSTEAAR